MVYSEMTLRIYTVTWGGYVYTVTWGGYTPSPGADIHRHLGRIYTVTWEYASLLNI